MKLILSILLLGTFAIAEPSKAFKYLMNEPVSMLDFGIYRLEHELRTNKPKLEIANNKYISSSNFIVHYNWNSNKIKVGGNIELSIKDKIIAKDICKNYIKELKQTIKFIFLINHDDYFVHSGYTNNKKPENLIQEIQNNIIYQVNVDLMIEKSKASKKGLTFPEDLSYCESSNNSNEILFSE